MFSSETTRVNVRRCWFLALRWDWQSRCCCCSEQVCALTSASPCTTTLFQWCFIGMLLWMIINVRVCVKAGWDGGVENKTNGWAPALTPFWREICVVNVLVFVSERSIQTRFQSLFLSPPSHPNRVPLPGHEGGGEWGSGVNQGSWIYDGKPHCLPERPLVWGCGH